MRNRNKKIIAIVLFVIASGLLIYNITNPYQEQSKNDNSVVTGSSAIDTTDESYPLTSQLSDEVVVEKEPSQEDLWREKYSGNQLANGAQPYRALYGKNKQFGTSRIKITASDDQDVLIMVKDNRNKVVRHAYICKGKSYTFRIPAGTYQVFFVSGDSWCPEKEAPNGEKGFFLDSSTSKGDKEFIDEYYTLSYTLQPLFYGNFSPQKTDDIEAF